MWISQALRTFREAAKAAQEPLANEQECKAYAEAAYIYCTALYGMPDDPKRPYDLFNGVGLTSGCNYALGKYTILLSPRLETREQQCMVIGHEMYHRVTMHRAGLRRELWIDEMMAFLTSYWFLKQQGFSAYAEAQLTHATASLGDVELDRMRGYQRLPWYRRLKDLGASPYPETFGADVTRVAIALKRIVDGNDLCRIIQAAALEEWIDSLPPEKQYGVCRVLEVENNSKRLPETTPDIHQFFNALVAKGDKALVVAELLEITRLQPSSGAAFFHQGRAYHNAKEFEAARNAYSTALDLKFPDKWVAYNLGSVCSSLKDYSSASSWYREATRQDPDWARAYYFQGRMLLKAGDLESARTAWEKTAGMNDEDCARWARIALEENPLPANAPE